MYKLLKFLLSILIIALFLFASYFLWIRLLSQTYDLFATNNTLKGDAASTITCLRKAVAYQPREDRLWIKLGKSYYALSKSQPPTQAFHRIQESKQAYQTAARLNAVSAEAFYGLALAETRLETLYPILYYKMTSPYNAAPYFDQAILFRPNSVSYQFAYARYLYNKRKKKSFLDAVSNLIKIYPPAYTQLTKEPFWSPEVKQAAQKGLFTAIDEDVNLYTAHGTLSSIFVQEGKWDEALRHYLQALRHQNIKKHTGNHIHLGRLYLKTGQFKNAEKYFFKAMSMSRNKTKTLKTIFTYYKECRCPMELLQFYRNLSNKFFLPVEIDILIARTLLDLGQADQARTLLNKLNQKKPNPEAYYWLAKTAEKEQDWDGMESAIQKATAIEPENSLYHETFSRVLVKMDKFSHAEKEADLAIRFAVGKKLPALYSHRASIKLRQQKFKSAIDDWESAIELEPENSRYYANIASTYTRFGEKRDALVYYKKALDLDPHNVHYQKKYRELSAE